MGDNDALILLPLLFSAGITGVHTMARQSMLCALESFNDLGTAFLGYYLVGFVNPDSRFTIPCALAPWL